MSKLSDCTQLLSMAIRVNNKAIAGEALKEFKKENVKVPAKYLEDLEKLCPDVELGDTKVKVDPDSNKVSVRVTKEVELSEDVKLAKKYLSKSQNAVSRGLDFTISLTSYKNIQKAKKCYYSGLPLDESTRTIDRVDRTKGYIKGNVVACHTSVNSLKEVLERPTQFGVSQEELIKMITKWSDKL